MCDLLAVTSRYPYKADEAVPAFVVIGSRNTDGWGLCYYQGEKPIVRKSARKAFDGQNIDAELLKLSREAQGKIILGHIRRTSSGLTDKCHSHPFVLEFLGREWTFAHNGTSRSIENYRSKRERLKTVKSDSARIFEFIRDRMLDDFEKKEFSEFGLFSALENAVAALLEDHEGGFNFLLTDGALLYAFSHYRPFWILHRSKTLGDASLITTIDQGLTDGENWFPVGDADYETGTLICFSDDMIVAKSEVSSGA
jgi:predicted glutamine amidotransferase